MRGNKNWNNLICSIFMSFSPMELIFIGWVGDIWKFYWVLRNFEFKPANEIFLQKGKFPAFQKKVVSQSTLYGSGFNRYVTYSPYECELDRIKTHEIRAKYFRWIFPLTLSIKIRERAHVRRQTPSKKLTSHRDFSIEMPVRCKTSTFSKRTSAGFSMR